MGGPSDRKGRARAVGPNPSGSRRLLEPSVRAVEETASTAGRDASLDPGFLGDYLRSVLRVAIAGERLPAADLDACRLAGEEAAREGVALSTLLDLYLSATWRLWADVDARAGAAEPAVVSAAAAATLRAADDAAAALADGYSTAQRRAIRQEEALRREFVDDLLRGGGDAAHIAGAAARLGFNLAAEHVAAVARTDESVVDAGPVHARIESRVLAAPGGREALVATKGGLLVCVFPGAVGEQATDLVRALEGAGEGPWRLAIGRAHAGPGGVARSFDEAREALELAMRLDPNATLVTYEQMLPYRLLARDPARLAELTRLVLGSLGKARGGGAHLAETLEAFFEQGGNVAATARALRLSTRAVTYRVARISELTGHSPREPEGAFVLQLALKGRRLLEAPTEPKGTSSPDL